MKRAISVVPASFYRVAAVVAMATFVPLTPAFAQYTYYYLNLPDPNFLTYHAYDYGTGLAVSNTYPTSPGEADMTISINPSNTDTEIAYLAASPYTFVGGGVGLNSYLAVEVTGTTVAVVGYSQGTTYNFAAATVSSFSSAVVRGELRTDGGVAVYVNNALVLTCSGAGGFGNSVGVGWANYGGYPGSPAFGPPDAIAPNPIPASSIGVSAGATYVDLQWPAATDDPNGTGIAFYQILRNGQLLATTTSLSYSDTTVVPATSYSYTISPYDFFLNYASTTINATTQHVQTNGPFPSTIPDGRRVGVASTGAYWGAGNEEIDVMSGNVNFSAPILTAMQRNSASVAFKLSYNSQNWRQDSGGTWQFGEDSGYGYGWKLMAGSITPVLSNPWTVSYFLFTDATGAQYRLDQNNNNIWTSEQSVYVTFDANADVLYFPDGTHWTFGCTSASTEPDSGVMYPTVMEDTNGNQVFITYQTATGADWSNSSSRISSINDIRGVNIGGGVYQTYAFSYTTFSGDSIPHLTAISNNIGTGEAYTFSYIASSLDSPISPYTAEGNTRLLS